MYKSEICFETGFEKKTYLATVKNFLKAHIKIAPKNDKKTLKNTKIPQRFFPLKHKFWFWSGDFVFFREKNREFFREIFGFIRGNFVFFKSDFNIILFSINWFYKNSSFINLMNKTFMP